MLHKDAMRHAFICASTAIVKAQEKAVAVLEVQDQQRGNVMVWTATSQVSTVNHSMVLS